MKLALERDSAGEAKLIPVLLRSFELKGTPLAEYWSLPLDVKPLSRSSGRDDALFEVAREIGKIVEELAEK